MQCIAIKKKPEKGSIDPQGQEHTDEYQVIFDSIQATRFDALNAECGNRSVPPIGMTAQGTTRYARVDPASSTGEIYAIVTIPTVFVVDKVEVQRDAKNARYWNVTVTWKPFVSGMSEQKPEGEKVKWHIDFSSEPVLYTEPTDYDFQGQELRMQTGEPFQPQFLKEYYDEEFIVRFRTDQPQFDEWAICQGNLNSESITLTFPNGQTRTFAAKTMKFPRPRYQLAFDKDGTTYFQCEYRFLIRLDTWIEKRQEKSLVHLTADDSGVEPGIDPKTGHFFEEPQYLNALGDGFVAPGDPLPRPTEKQISKAVPFTKILAGIGGIEGEA